MVSRLEIEKIGRIEVLRISLLRTFNRAQGLWQFSEFGAVLVEAKKVDKLFEPANKEIPQAVTPKCLHRSIL